MPEHISRLRNQIREKQRKLGKEWPIPSDRNELIQQDMLLDRELEYQNDIIERRSESVDGNPPASPPQSESCLWKECPNKVEGKEKLCKDHREIFKIIQRRVYTRRNYLRKNKNLDEKTITERVPSPADYLVRLQKAFPGIPESELKDLSPIKLEEKLLQKEKSENSIKKLCVWPECDFQAKTKYCKDHQIIVKTLQNLATQKALTIKRQEGISTKEARRKYNLCQNLIQRAMKCWKGQIDSSLTCLTAKQLENKLLVDERILDGENYDIVDKEESQKQFDVDANNLTKFLVNELSNKDVGEKLNCKDIYEIRQTVIKYLENNNG